LFGEGFVLLKLGERASDVSRLVAAARNGGVPLREVTITEQAVATLYEQPLVLVRPDGHVAWRGEQCPADAEAVIDRVRGGIRPNASSLRDMAHGLQQHARRGIKRTCGHCGRVPSPIRCGTAGRHRICGNGT
jgi:hypothetical protein